MAVFWRVSLSSAALIGLATLAEGQVILRGGPAEPTARQQRRAACRQVVAPVVPQTDREQLRAEFVRARQEYADMLVSVLASEELAGYVRRIAAEIRLQRAQNDLERTRQALWELQTSGRAGTEDGRRIAAQVATAEADLARLRSAGVPDAAPGDWGDAAPARDVLVQRLRTKMDEETALMADSLDAAELDKRTRRLHRLVGVARIAGQFRGAGQGPIRLDLGNEVPAGFSVTPAGAGDGPAIGNPDGPTTALRDRELGPATTVPPSFPGRK